MEEGKRICIKIIQQVREIVGVHVMADRQEEAVAEIIQRAGLFPRRARRSIEPAATTEV